MSVESGVLDRMWCDTVGAAAKGKTAGTFDDVGTVTIKQHPTAGKFYRIIGVVGLITAPTITAGESSVPVWSFTSDDLGITEQEVVGYSNVLGDPVATNDKEFPTSAFFEPLSVDPMKSTNNAKIDFKISGEATTTGGWTAAIGVIYGNGIPDENLKRELATLTTRPFLKGSDTVDSASKAASYTAFTTGLSIPADAKQLVALLALTNPNAPTTVEASCAIYKFESSQISDFQPQIWPSSVGHNASLGTPVGTAPVGRGHYWPTRFPLPGNNITVDVSNKFVTALTNAPDNIAAYKARG